jgi:hypothetical protein
MSETHETCRKKARKKMKKYQVSYSTAYGIDHATVYAHNKTEARRIFNANKPIAGSKIIEIEEV